MTSAFYEKLIGTILLLAGLAIIGQGIKFGSDIFLSGKNPPEIFKPVDISAGAGKNSPNDSANTLPKNLNEINPADLQKLVSNNVLSPETIKSVIPPEMFNYFPKMLNLSALGIFLWILIIAGAKVSSLGITLIKINAVPKI